MVDAQAGHEALAQEAKDQPVHRREDVGVLDADGGQVVDVEEPAIVNLLGGHAPVAETVGLLGQEGRQAIETPRLALAAVHRRDHGRDGVAGRCARRHQVREATLPHFFSRWCSRTFSGSVSVWPGRYLQGGDDALQFDQVRVIRRERRAQVLQRRREDGNPGARGDGEMPVGAGDGEGPLVVAQANVALFEDFPILVPQDGEQHFVRQDRLRGAQSMSKKCA